MASGEKSNGIYKASGRDGGYSVLALLALVVGIVNLAMYFVSAQAPKPAPQPDNSQVLKDLTAAFNRFAESLEKVK